VVRVCLCTLLTATSISFTRPAWVVFAAFARIGVVRRNDMDRCDDMGAWTLLVRAAFVEFSHGDLQVLSREGTCSLHARNWNRRS